MAKKPQGAGISAEAIASVTGKPTTVPKGYKVARRVTSPLISVVHEKTLSVIVDGEIVAQEVADSDKPKMAPMKVVAVTRLDTGEEATLIVPTVIESALRRTPGGYIGKAFMMVATGKATGKRYNNFEVYELEDG